MKVFDSLAYLHLPKELNPEKFDSRTLMCIFIGYCPNGYRLWNPRENKILYRNDVIFDESKNIKCLVEYDYQEEVTRKEVEDNTIEKDPNPEEDQENNQEEESQEDS